MKKFFITTIAIIFALSLALMIGCGEKPGTPDGGKTETTVTIAASDKAYVVTGGTLEGIATAKDESGNALIVMVNNDGGFDSQTPGVYNVEFKAEKDGELLPGQYTVLSGADGVDAFNVRVGGFVRELHHGDTIVLGDGEEITAVSHTVVLR